MPDLKEVCPDIDFQAHAKCIPNAVAPMCTTYEESATGLYRVYLDLSIDPSGALSTESKHYSANFAVSKGELASLDAKELSELVQKRYRYALLTLKGRIASGSNIGLIQPCPADD